MYIDFAADMYIKQLPPAIKVFKKTCSLVLSKLILASFSIMIYYNVNMTNVQCMSKFILSTHFLLNKKFTHVNVFIKIDDQQ